MYLKWHYFSKIQWMFKEIDENLNKFLLECIPVSLRYIIKRLTGMFIAFLQFFRMRSDKTFCKHILI